MSPARFVMVLGLIGAASGCGMPAYHHVPEPAQASALLNVTSAGQKWICAHGEPQRLYGNASGYADIPANGRVTVGTLFAGQRYKCISGTSFIPQPGQRYRIDFHQVNEQCISKVYGEDPTAVAGLRLEASECASDACLY